MGDGELAGGNRRVTQGPAQLVSMRYVNPEEFSQLLQRRRSVRDFAPTPIPPETLESILDDARHVASWSNTRPYAIAVAQGKQLRRISASYIQAYDSYLQAKSQSKSGPSEESSATGRPDGDFNTQIRYPDDLRARSVKVGKGLYGHMGIDRNDQRGRYLAERRNLEFFGAPTVVFLFVRQELLPFSAQDGGLFLQAVMLSAQARGVASCALGTLATWRHPVEREFVIPPNYQLITGLSLGYASDAKVNEFRADHPPVDRLRAR